MNKLPLNLTIFLLIILLAGCIQHRQPNLPTVMLTTTPSPVGQPTLVYTASPTVTHVLHTITPQSMLPLVPSASPTQQSSPTRTRPPKLSLEEQQQRLGWLLRTNGECSFPCVWGFVPGQTTIAEARTFLRSMDQIFDVPDAFPTTFRFHNMDGSLGHIGAGEFTLNRGIIVSIRLLVRLNIQDIPRSDWAAFTPESIFNAYGLPSEIRFRLDVVYSSQSSEQQAIPFIDMFLFFDELNTIVEYDHEFVQQSDDYYHYCPASLDLPSVGVYMWMGKEPSDPPSHDIGIPLENAATLSYQEFYQLIIENPGTACIDLKAEAFKDQ